MISKGNWKNGFKGYQITGPTTPNVSGTTVGESLARHDWERRNYKGESPCGHTPICIGMKTIAIVVWNHEDDLAKKEAEYNAQLIACAPKMLKKLKELYKETNDKSILKLIKETKNIKE